MGQPADAGGGAGADAARSGQLLLTDMPLGAIALHVIKLIGLWVGIAMAVYYGSVGTDGGPADAAMRSFGIGLIPAAMLHLDMFYWLMERKKRKRLESDVADLKERQVKAADEIMALRKMVLALKANDG